MRPPQCGRNSQQWLLRPGAFVERRVASVFFIGFIRAWRAPGDGDEVLRVRLEEALQLRDVVGTEFEAAYADDCKKG
jgi:hypothetical protein